MHRRLLAWLPLIVSLVVILISTLSSAQSILCSRMGQGPEGSLNGFVPFPASSLWNTNIASAPVDPNSAAIISFIGSSTPLHADFGAGLYDGQSMGIPYYVVPGNQPPVNINYTAYGDESDPGPMPIPFNAPIEGYPNPGNGDRHVLVIDKGNCWLYELYGAYLLNPGLWNAGSGAVWDLTANEQRPYTWTSADAAGLPIFPGLVRYDEVASGHINHAIRMTLHYSKQAFTPPASHWAANSSNQYAAPMGMRLRLKASFDISGYPPDDQVILTALKQYGMIMADNGSSLFITGTPDNRWNNDNLSLLRQVTASNFEVLLISPLYTPQNVPTGPNPTINSFMATSSGGSGQPVTLSWNVSNAGYYVISPSVGAIRGNSVVVYPTVSTMYTLYATNQFGRTTAQVTVHVP
ncbi:MAG TPA: hypothetical protein VL240_00275 [Candidatus Binatia bacterium]|nr:hypothetical protein [Candidatus Binatia bacterium]